MTYSKPDVMLLGEATVVVESLNKVPPTIEATNHSTPAYDLDE